MLLILIPAAWLLIATLFLVLCRMAARGDDALAARPRRASVSHSFPGLVLFEQGRVETSVQGDARIGTKRVVTVAPRDRRSRCVTR